MKMMAGMKRMMAGMKSEQDLVELLDHQKE